MQSNLILSNSAIQLTPNHKAFYEKCSAHGIMQVVFMMILNQEKKLNADELLHIPSDLHD